VIQVAAEHQLTIYDAAYLELPQRTLATLDGDLQKAALTANVALVET
jgi:predicted nucleic acid-binding protein